jgi:hypothetical protein
MNIIPLIAILLVYKFIICNQYHTIETDLDANVIKLKLKCTMQYEYLDNTCS